MDAGRGDCRKKAQKRKSIAGLPPQFRFLPVLRLLRFFAASNF
jgi:hypothetical protein